MLWDMIRYENYDETSPYNREAAAWAKHQTYSSAAARPPAAPRQARPTSHLMDDRCHLAIPLPRTTRNKPFGTQLGRRLLRPAAQSSQVRRARRHRPRRRLLGEVIECRQRRTVGEGDMLFIE